MNHDADGARPPDLARLTGHIFPATTQAYTERDCMLYALGLGLGQDPCAPGQLQYVYESELRVLPTLSAVLANPTGWMRDPSLGIQWRQLVALSHRLEFHQAMPPRGTARSTVRVDAVYDLGAKGALLQWSRQLEDAGSGAHWATMQGTALLRGNGEFGGRPAPARAAPATPSRDPDLRLRWQTSTSQGLIYRLSGDFNPLHSDPEVARQAGFERPILHGLCTLAICGHTLISAVCAGDPARLSSLSANYSGVVYPGETLDIAIWRDAGALLFECRVLERDCLALTAGVAKISNPAAWPLGN